MGTSRTTLKSLTDLTNIKGEYPLLGCFDLSVEPDTGEMVCHQVEEERRFVGIDKKKEAESTT